MFDLNGKYGTAKVYTDICENEAAEQIINVLNQPFSDGANIRIMPDVHAGAGCTIGTTMKITDKVCPNLVGVDIGCGMFVAKITSDLLQSNPELFLKTLDETITQHIPNGKAVNAHALPEAEKYRERLEELYYIKERNENIDYIVNSLGSLGGGNHFIEVNQSEDNTAYLVIHSGSRYLGKAIATWYQNKAIEKIENCKEERLTLIAAYKKEGREKEIQKALKNITPEPFQKELACCEGELLEQYLHDMAIVQDFAILNRKLIAKQICNHFTADTLILEECFTTIHNYIDMDNGILRKGAVSAQKGETLIIPINMRDGSLICKGKGNPDWNYSAPHGAGRLLSRSKARESISLEEFKEAMKGIYSTSVCSSTTDESPMAYKAIDDIVNNIGDTVEIIERIKPIYNFKAH